MFRLCLIRLGFAFALGYGVVPARASNGICNEKYRLVESDEAEFKRISTRDPSRALLDDAYLAKLRYSMDVAFIPWFEGSDSISFKEALREQHKRFVLGPSGDGIYHGASRRHYTVKKDVRAQAGVYRHEMNDPEGPLRITIDLASELNGNLPPEFEPLKSELVARIKKRDETLVPAKGGGPYRLVPSDEPLVYPTLAIETPGFAPDEWPLATWVGDTVQFTYPKRAMVPRYLAEMTNVMGQLRTFSATGPAGRAKLVDLLATYVNLGAKGHPFNMGNFSLVMAHVNYVLVKNGFRGISHGNLDFQALVRAYPDFRRVFSDAVERENPAIFKP